MSVDPVERHEEWKRDIESVSGATVDARARFGEDAVEEVTPYLRYTDAPA